RPCRRRGGQPDGVGQVDRGGGSVHRDGDLRRVGPVQRRIRALRDHCAAGGASGKGADRTMSTAATGVNERLAKLSQAGVSVWLGVAPESAYDTERTLDMARVYWKAVNRPNLMIKIPGTPAGVPAIEQAIYEGINVNVTLLFAVEAYERVAEAYLRGLERRQN